MAEPAALVSSNFSFLAAHSGHLVRLAAQAERYLADDPNTCLIKLRQFTELLAQRVAANVGLYASGEDNFRDLLLRLQEKRILASDVQSLFHGIRRAGNEAAHNFAGTHDEALKYLKMAWQLAAWFHVSFGKDPTFKIVPFTAPTDRRRDDGGNREQVERLKQELEATRKASNAAQVAAQEEMIRRLEAEAKAKLAEGEQAQLRQAVQEAEAQFRAERQKLAEEMTALQAATVAEPEQVVKALITKAQDAGEHLDLDESTTRLLIDQQLRDAGWEVDTEKLRYASGTRPIKGKNLAVAEWPTESGPADYALFVGLRLVGVVEAKRRNRDVSDCVKQAGRYSTGIKHTEGLVLDGPWGDYRVPFLFSTNGRPYLRQIETKSGIWFRDARRPQNHAHALESWYTPEGLIGLLDQDIDKATTALQTETFSYLDMRDYQKDAIRAVEAGIQDGRHEMLVAMATGTGKTRTAIGMVYRLIKAKRFRRVLFLVDRSALGEQTENAFNDMRIENLQTFAQIYDLKGLDDMAPDSDTRLHIATVQGMVKRILYPTSDMPPAIDQYDCIIVDECHRGYNLDREMSEIELTFRSEEDYFSKYRRVLDHFDAIKIGLTATPALHTTQVFGDPIYQYSYRQAVIDGFLIDHEPPIQIRTALGEDGIAWLAGEQMQIFNGADGTIDLVHAPDDLQFAVEDFNKRVVTENFNRVVCEELARQIDPTLPGKTLIFCATDNHADLVVDLLKKAMDAQYGAIDDDLIAKITGAADKPLLQIRRYKNEKAPSIAVTVDLLTTGIDVPEIVNLVFIRVVRSRILYEQMLGRATRRCDDIGKERFRIFDAVGLYEKLAPVSSMKPVVTDPSISFETLVGELQTVKDEQARQVVFDQLVAKFQRKARKLDGIGDFQTLAKMNPAELLRHLKQAGPGGAATWFKDHADLALFLDRIKTGDGPQMVISTHEDQLRRVERGYGNATRPEDYLESFSAFIRDNMNEIPALVIVTQRPRDLMRQQLKELKLALDLAGYNEAALQTAWREMTNQDIAASIIGFIRQRSLGSPLVPYGERVEMAVKRILASQAWTSPQRTWLERIGKQVKEETIVDREAMDRGQFQANGGFARINKIFDGRLEALLGDLQDQVWKDAG